MESITTGMYYYIGTRLTAFLVTLGFAILRLALHRYFGLTVSFILLPSLTMTGFSFRWYLLDADNQQLPEVPLWRWALRLAVLMLQVAPILRYFDSIRYGVLSRVAEFKSKRYD